MKHLKIAMFAMMLGIVALFVVPDTKAAVIYSDSSSGITTEVTYVSHEEVGFIFIQPGASYTFECEAHDDGYNEWTLSVTDSSGTYTCHAWNNRNVFMSEGRDTYWAVIGNEPEIMYFYITYVNPLLPPPPEG